MAILRFLGRLFVLLAFVCMALLIFVWLGGHATEPAGRVWFELHLTSLSNTEVFVARYLEAPEFWRDQAVPYLQLDAWEALLWPVILFMVLGGLLVYLGRRRRRRGGFQQ